MSVGVDAQIAHDASACYLTYGRWEYELAGLDDAALRAGLDELDKHETNFDLRRVMLRIYDQEGQEVTKNFLINLLQMEIDRGGDTYVRVERRWFRCRGEYIQRVEERVAGIPNLTMELTMPPWDKKVHPDEKDYNAYVAGAKDWLLQDQKFFYHGQQKLEPCDLLSPYRHFIHAKEGLTSSALSHLFGQASGAAELLRHHKAFYAEVRLRFETKWPDRDFDKSGKPTVVLAIARPPGGDLLGNMLLSKINLLEHVKRIQGRGYDVAVCRMDLLNAKDTSGSTPVPSGSPD